MPRKKPTHGGSRPGAGRPTTTGSRAMPVVSFRLSAKDRSAVEREASRRGMKVNSLAKSALLNWLLEPKSYAGTK